MKKIVTIGALALFILTLIGVNALNTTQDKDLLMKNMEALSNGGKLPPGAVIGSSMERVYVEVEHPSDCFTDGGSVGCPDSAFIWIVYKTGGEHYKVIYCCVENEIPGNACDPTGEFSECANIKNK